MSGCPVGRLPCHGPGEMLWVIPDAGAIRQEELWNTVLVQVALNRRIGDITQTLKDERDLILLNQAPDLLDGFRRAVTIIEADEIDPAAVDAALLVDHPEVGELCPANRPVSGNRPAIGHGLTDPDFGVSDAGSVLLFSHSLLCRPCDER